MPSYLHRARAVAVLLACLRSHRPPSSNTRDGGDAIRALTRCFNPSNGYHYHSLDLSCASGDTTEATYGYVH